MRGPASRGARAGNFGEKLVLERPFCLWRIRKGTPVAPTVSVCLAWAPPHSRGRGTASQQARGLVERTRSPLCPFRRWTRFARPPRTTPALRLPGP